MPNKFNDWLAKMDGLEKKLGTQTLVDVAESFHIAGRTIELQMGKVNRCRIDGTDIVRRQLRPHFTKNKQIFWDVLEVMTERVDQTMATNDGVLTGIVYEAIPDAVIKRMKGDIAGNVTAQDLLERMVKTKMLELGNSISHMVRMSAGLPHTLGVPFEVNGSEITFWINFGDWKLTPSPEIWKMEGNSGRMKEDDMALPSDVTPSLALISMLPQIEKKVEKIIVIAQTLLKV